MKTKLLLSALSLGAFFAVKAQPPPQPGATDSSLSSTINPLVATDYAIIERDGNQKVWSKVTLETNSIGKVTAKTNSYVELATASAHLVNGEWTDYNPQIQLSDIGARATNTHHPVSFLGNIKEPRAIDLTLPGKDKHLAGSVIGLAYEDLATGKSVLIAALKDSQGEI